MALDRLAPKKSFSQNFLNDINISRKIVRTLEIEEGDSVIEIGPGTGALTQILLEEKIRLTAVELDERAIAILKKNFPAEKYPDFRIHEGDVRAFPLESFALSEKEQGRNLRVLGNIPYSITSDILFWVFENAHVVRRVVLMMQREVAQRLVAAPRTKDYGILTVAAALTGKTRLEFNVAPHSFFPPPKVTSTVVSFTPHATLLSRQEYSSVHALVRAAFGQRRKMLSNALSGFISQKTRLSVQEILSQPEAPEHAYFTKRAEELSPADFTVLEKYLRQYYRNNA